MTVTDIFAPFRLDLAQQHLRAQALLRAAAAGEPAARQRLGVHCDSTRNPAPTLATAQDCIARELRLPDWQALERHCALLQQQREQLSNGVTLDDDLRTLHIRCGHDIQQTLRTAGLDGAFDVQIDPYVQGPVTADNDWLQRRAEFLCAAFGPAMQLQYAETLAECRDSEPRLLKAIHDYQRVVLWFELDAYDQLILLRCLACFAEHGLPPRLELVDAADYPGSQRFLGLGQLPPEALRLLWQQRRVLEAQHAEFARTVWQAYRSDDPRELCRLAAAGTPLLPTLAPALLRQLQELPSPANALGLTQQLLLTTLKRLGRTTVAQLISETMRVRDALSGIGDSGLDYELRQLERASPAILVREHHGSMRDDLIELTACGSQLLDGNVSWLALSPPPRWVGGVCIMPGQRNWHWDAATQQVLLL